MEWKKRNGVWVIEEEQPQKPAKPHYITILLGILSPVIGVVALFISLRSLQTTQLSMETAQRAYITLSDSVVTFHDPFKGGQNMDTVPLLMTFSTKYHNLGTTPATFRKVTLLLKMPRGWYHSNHHGVHKFEVPSDHLPVDINARSDSTWTGAEAITLKAEAYQAYRHRIDPSMRFADVANVVIYGTATYDDVFGKGHDVNWCWEVKFPSIYPHDCSRYEPLVDAIK